MPLPAAQRTTWASRRPGGGCRDTGGRQPRPGTPDDPEFIRLGPHGPAVAAELTTQLLRLPDPPTAIFAASDTQAMGVLKAAEQCGFPVPAGLSVMGFDDIESAALLSLSTVRQPLEQSGAEGARRLCALLRGFRIRPLRQWLPLWIVQRSSTARPRQPGNRRPGNRRPGNRRPGGRQPATAGRATAGRATVGQAGVSRHSGRAAACRAAPAGAASAGAAPVVAGQPGNCQPGPAVAGPPAAGRAGPQSCIRARPGARTRCGGQRKSGSACAMPAAPRELHDGLARAGSRVPC